MPPTPGPGQEGADADPAQGWADRRQRRRASAHARRRHAPRGRPARSTEREQIFTFRDVPAPPTPSLLRDFSAPVRLTTSLDPDQIEFLMMHDSDPFNRWQAAQTYATQPAHRCGARRRQYRNASPAKKRPGLRKRLPPRRATSSLLTAYRAEFLKLPGESDIARELAHNVDPDAVHAAREALRETIGARSARLWRSSTTATPERPLFARPGKRRHAAPAQRRARSARGDRRCVGDRARRAPLP